ncbi:MAG: sulfotransferase [Verrucomicrobiota bacterium]
MNSSVPTFLIIGASKSGTSTLHQALSSHPEIFMSSPKEPHYFSAMDNRLPSQGPDDISRLNLNIHSWEDYLTLFENAASYKARGESSTTYISTPGTARRIKEKLPQIQLIAVLRNPVDRAYSSYMHLVRDGNERAATFEEGLAQEPQRRKEGWEGLWHYQDRGFYYRQLREYYDLFDQSQIKVLLYEDLNKYSQTFLKELLTFIGVDPDWPIDLSQTLNKGGLPGSPKIHRVVAGPQPWKQPIKKILSSEIRNQIKELYLKTTMRKTSMRQETRKQLQLSYRDDILNLQDLIGTDLSHWLT